MSKIDDARAELRKLELEEQEAQWAARRCRVCKDTDEEFGGNNGALTSFELTVAASEEGYSHIDSWLCETHLVIVAEGLANLGISIHAHGGICFLEDTQCAGAEVKDNCPQPENQY